MRRKITPYRLYHVASAIFMLVALIWLTISTPFIYASQQKLAGLAQSHVTSGDCNEVEDTNPLSDTSEEKSAGNNSIFEDYIHHHNEDAYFFSSGSPFFNEHNADTYIAFHGELLVPPPDMV